jgi:hypothetical protein
MDRKKQREVEMPPGGIDFSSLKNAGARLKQFVEKC